MLLKKIKSKLIPNYTLFLRTKSNKELKAKRKKFFKNAKDNISYKSIPVFIISFNRLTYLKNCIKWLEHYGFKNIQIIDNKSTYQPLLDYYGEIDYQVLYMDKNYGHKVLWNSGKFDDIVDNNFYILTDPDVEPVSECPKDFLFIMLKYLKKYHVRKVGPSLKIDDLPEKSKIRNDVIKWESRMYNDKLLFSNAYLQMIDTTFALYAPNQLVKNLYRLDAIRIGYPIQFRHLPWYHADDDFSDEDILYFNSKREDVAHWGTILKELHDKK